MKNLNGIIQLASSSPKVYVFVCESCFCFCWMRTMLSMCAGVTLNLCLATFFCPILLRFKHRRSLCNLRYKLYSSTTNIRVMKTRATKKTQQKNAEARKEKSMTMIMMMCVIYIFVTDSESDDVEVINKNEKIK